MISHSSGAAGGAEDDFERMLKYLHGTDQYEIYALFPEGPRVSIWKNYCAAYGLYHWGWLPVINEGILSYIKYIFKFFIQAAQISKFVNKNSYDICIINVAVLVWPVIILGFKKQNILLMIKEHIQPDFIRKLVYKIAEKRVRYFIANSDKIADEIELFAGKARVGRANSVVENNLIISRGNLINKIKPSDYEMIVSEEGFKFVNVGGISPRKNQLLILEALKKIKESGNGIKIIAIHVGKPSLDEPYGRDVREFIINNDLASVFIQVGELAREDLYELYSYINAVIISSLSEGMPVVLVEALKFGKPLISTKAGGITEIIINNENGLLIEPEVNSLFEGMSKLAFDKQYYDRISANMLKTYKENFDFDTNMKKLKSLIDRNIN